MLANVPIAYASTLIELWAGGFSLGGVPVDWTVDWITEINASRREHVSRPSAICNKQTYI